MKSRITHFLHQASGGLTKDLKLTSIVALCIFATIATTIKILLIQKYILLYIPVLWFLLGITCYVLKNKYFLFFVMFIALFISFTDLYSYREMGIFFLMIYVLTKTRRQRIACFSLVGVSSMISYSLQGGNLIDTFAILIQFAFASFCYYGFIYIRVADMDHHSKLIYTDEERVILHALATQDKLQKEVAYELGMTVPEITYILNRIKKKNSISTTDMLLRLYAIEASKNQNS